jgi:hypothetical protein
VFVHFLNIFLVGASQKKPIFSIKKMKNEIFVQRKLKLTKATLFAIPRCTHVHNIGSFEQTMSWLWLYPSSCAQYSLSIVLIHAVILAMRVGNVQDALQWT